MVLVVVVVVGPGFRKPCRGSRFSHQQELWIRAQGYTILQHCSVAAPVNSC